MAINLYKALSLLLDYPEAELIDSLDELERRIGTVDHIDATERAVLKTLIDHLRRTDLTELQADYVQTFDLTPEHSLHLTHHLFGDDKNRGPALIDLTEMYKEYGLRLAANELPDFLPLVLEFAALLDDGEARMFLGDAAKVTRVLAANLEQADSVYAPCIRLIENRGGLVKLAA
jgi:nitrate reductase molybdenum cofactor assembly chaperone NarJ/NarW